MRSTLYLVAAVVTLSACAESPTQTADGEPAFATSGNSHGRVVGSASGSGHALCTPDGADCRADVGGEGLLDRYPELDAKDLALRSFSFTAQLLEDGTARGKAQYNNRGREEAWDVDVECMLFRSGSGKPNQVWMLGRLTRGYGGTAAPPNPPHAKGVGVLFAVEDNGEGASAGPDRMVGFATVPEPNYLAVCPLFNAQVEILPFDVFFGAFSFEAFRGNVQVRPPSAD
jgi:hypothetical protein